MRHLAKQRDASFFVLFFKTCQYGVLTINITYKKLDSGKAADQGGNASNGGQATNGGSTTGQSAKNGQSGQTQNNAGAQQLPQTGNANNEKGALGLAGAMFAAGLGLGFGSKKKRHEN